MNAHLTKCIPVSIVERVESLRNLWPAACSVYGPVVCTAKLTRELRGARQPAGQRGDARSVGRAVALGARAAAARQTV